MRWLIDGPSVFSSVACVCCLAAYVAFVAVPLGASPSAAWLLPVVLAFGAWIAWRGEGVTSRRARWKWALANGVLSTLGALAAVLAAVDPDSWGRLAAAIYATLFAALVCLTAPRLLVRASPP